MNKVLKWYRSIQSAVIVTLFTVIVAVVFFQVLNRTIFKFVISWPEELARYLMVWLIYVSSVVAFRKGANVGMDFLVSRARGKVKIALDIFQCVCVVAFALVTSYFSVGLIEMQLRLNQTSPALGVKMGYVYMAVTVWGVLTSLEVILSTVQNIRELSPPGESKEETA